MAQVLEYRSPPSRKRVRPIVWLAMVSAVAFPLLQVVCFGSDLLMRQQLQQRFTYEWQANELLRRAHERSRRAVGYATAPQPPAAPAPPTLRGALLRVTAWARWPLAVLAIVFGTAMSRRGWPAAPPAWLRWLAVIIGSASMGMLIAAIIGYGLDSALEHPIRVTFVIASIAFGLALVAPVFEPRERQSL